MSIARSKVGLTVRKAGFGDIMAVKGLMEEAHAQSRFAEYPLDDRLFKSTCIEAIRTGGKTGKGCMCLYVAVAGDRTVGFVIGATDDCYAFTRAKCATVLVFYVAPDFAMPAALRLGRAFMAWAKQLPGVVSVEAGVTDALGDYGKAEVLLKRLGLEQHGVIYGKRRA